MTCFFLPPRRSAVALFSLLLLSFCLGRTQGRSYFPEQGSGALQQRALEARHPWVAMMVSLEPGMEDFPGIAWLRLATGASVINLYATNGEGTPSDYSGETPGDVAGRRKMEAVRSTLILDGEAYFLDLRDPGFLKDRKALEEAWIPDSAVSRMVAAIRTNRPDVIILARDQRADSAVSLRQTVLQGLLQRAIREARSAGQHHGPLSPLADRAWSVKRLFVDLGRPKQPTAAAVGRRHPVWNKSYAAIGLEAAAPYASLSGHIASYWRSGNGRSYTPISLDAGAQRSSFEGGLLLFDEHLRAVERGVASVVSLVGQGKETEALKPLLDVLEKVDYTVTREFATLTDIDRRAITLWKNRLENLRCTLLNVNVTFEMSDSLLTERQLFFLRFKKFSADLVGGQTQILFPGIGQGDWIVTEGKANSQVFPFAAPKEFQMLTPQKMRYTRPVIQYGLALPVITENLSFIIFHRDTVRERSFVYRKEVPLGIGPRGTAELLTPVVRLTPGERVVYGVWNFMRDPLKGEASVQDSLASGGPQSFFVRQKDEVDTDTLTLDWKREVPSGDYVMDFRVWDRPRARQLIARKFDAAADTAHRVGLITALQGSPVAEALRRLHVPTVALDSGAVHALGLGELGTIIIDRDALALRHDCSSWIPAIGSWVRSGGHLIVLPQYEAAGQGEAFAEGISFAGRPHMESTEPVETDPSSPMLTIPNRISAVDWQGWVVSRAMGSVQIKNGTGLHVAVRSPGTGAALLVNAPQGKGNVTFVALDLWSQLLNVHPGSYRLLANLVNPL